MQIRPGTCSAPKAQPVTTAPARCIWDMGWRGPFAWVVYPALVAGTFRALQTSGSGGPEVLVLLAVPSILVGAIVRRRFMYAVPPVVLGFFLVIGLAAGWFVCGPNVSCEDDPQTLAEMIGIFVGGMSMLGLAVGDVIGGGVVRSRAAASRGS